MKYMASEKKTLETFKKEFKKELEGIEDIEELKEIEDIAVLAITDYFSLDAFHLVTDK